MNKFQFIFPEMLARLDYAHKLTPADVAPAELPDARDIMQWYFTDMTRGVEYERRLNEPWNTGLPHTLMRANFENARNVSSMGWKYAELPPVLDRVLPELERLPPWADLLETAEYDSAVGDLIEVLNGYKGFLIANSCKVFYQKRPRLVPILDEFNRQALNVPWVQDGVDVVTPAIQTVRRVAVFGPNERTLSNLRGWLRDNPAVTGGLPLSTLRILDILAWGVVRRRNDAAR